MKMCTFSFTVHKSTPWYYTFLQKKKKPIFCKKVKQVHPNGTPTGTTFCI